MRENHTASELTLQKIVRADSFAGHLSAAQAVSLAQQFQISMPQLMLRLLPLAAQYAVAPLSGFHVGAIAMGQSGALYLGANLEFPGQAPSFAIHAEQASIANAWLNGEQAVSTLAVSAAPCGHCRQFLYELVTAQTLVIVRSQRNPTLLTACLPDAFGPQDLGVRGGLMTPQSHGLVLQTPNTDPLVCAALAAANASYAPYTKAYAGVALRLSDGTILSGRYAENAAYNPSMSALGSALSRLVLSGRDYSAITAAALVEQPAKASQVDTTRIMLRSISEAPLIVSLSA